MDKLPLNAVKDYINSVLAGKEPWQIVTMTTSTVLLTVWIYEYFQEEGLVKRCKSVMFHLARKVPSIKQQIDEQMQNLADGFRNDMEKQAKIVDYITKIPNYPKTKDQVLEVMRTNLKLGNFDWKNGKVSGSVYYNADEQNELIKEVFGMTSYTNPLHPDIFPGVCKMEAEVVRMAVNLFHGDEEACGSMTTGGTESIMMACKAYRDYGRHEKGIKKPNMVIPVTAHAAFDKSGIYMGIHVKKIPIDPITMKVNINKMRSAIDKNTIMLVGSAPNYPYGTIDDLKEISKLGLRYNVPVHVDSCLGGFLTAFMHDAGYPVGPCDFQLEGVTSISADTHKYGFTPKGSSIVMYRHSKFRTYQYTVTTDWPGGVYGSPTVSGSRAGGNIAACWATMMKFGHKGYVKATKEIIDTTRYIEAKLRNMDYIFVYGQPATSVIALGSKVFDIYRLSSGMNEKGWNLNALQFPSGIHICVTHMHTPKKVAEKFVQDIEECLKEIMKAPETPVSGKMAIYGVAQAIPDRSIVEDFVCCFLDSLFLTPKIAITANGEKN